MFHLRLAILCVLLVPLEAPARAEDGDASVVGEVRDAILLDDGGPIHLRFHVALGKKSPPDARTETVRRLMETLDTNGDGRLSRDEAQRSPLLREKQRPGADGFLKSIHADMSVSRKDVEKKFDRLETVNYRQNVESADTDRELFRLLDSDGNGIVSEAEMLDAVDRILAKDGDDDECVTLDEFAPVVDDGQMTPTVIPRAAPKPTKVVAEILQDTRQNLLAARLIQKYDKDRNSKLSADELKWSKDRIASCDKDGDGQLNVRELADLKNSPVDIEVAVDVIRTNGEPMLRIINSTGKRTDRSTGGDLATLQLSVANITFLTRETNPLEASMELAMRVFNELDMDNNGYLVRTEAMQRERFERGLFDQIDADGDGKIFGEEMKEFIRARGEPDGMTCQVLAFDDGAGFFSALDANGDRRISMREMRYADRALIAMQRDKEPGLGENEPVRHYRIEFSRGIFNPFGNSGRRQAMADPTVVENRRTVGPIWFQRWDRNNDGDLTWREFLGPRDAFEQLDADDDGLIDPGEAEAAAKIAMPRQTRQDVGAND